MSYFIADDYDSIDRAGRELHARGWRKAFTLNEMFEWRRRPIKAAGEFAADLAAG
ncbi:hypothetical protein [Nocardioides sp. WS12]|uniref:hypothetical protein n=1 Tax=Nocardioides sp. WS12 TaxID=2486272 RepID=UPI0015F9108B|nr:hypothetical protein [Nocardioides sp. WS12]